MTKRMRDKVGGERKTPPARPGQAKTVRTLEPPAAGPLHPKRLGNLKKPPSLFGDFRPDPVR